MKQLSDIDWSEWRARDPATLVFVFRDFIFSVSYPADTSQNVSGKFFTD